MVYFYREILIRDALEQINNFGKNICFKTIKSRAKYSSCPTGLSLTRTGFVSILRLKIEALGRD